MNLDWNLENIYSSFNCDDFKRDLSNLDLIISDIKIWSNDLRFEKEFEVRNLEDYINKFIQFENISKKLSSYINLILSVDSNDEEAVGYLGILENKVASISGSKAKLQKYISQIHNINGVIEKSEILKSHRFILDEIAQKGTYLLEEREELIIANLKKSGSSTWSRLKDNLVSNLMVDIELDGENKQLPLTVILNMAYDSDKKVRKLGYEAEMKAYKKIEEGVCASLNGIKGEAITICDTRGYVSVLQKSILDSRLKEETLNAMIESIEEFLPIFRKYLKRKAEILGYDGGLPFYDLFAPISKVDMRFSFEEAGKFVVENFNTFSSSLSNFAKRAIQERWIDVMPKEGKVGGAFCENLHFIGESRIMLNFGGTFSDVVTLAHELGHGFHGECLKKESVLNSEYPMPIAETASTFCEMIIQKSAVKKADKNQKLAILENEISDCTQIIVDIYSRFVFEKTFCEARREKNLSVEETKKLMINAQKKAYGEGLDSNVLHPYMWLWKPHYYDVEYNYYNFPYAFGLLFSKGLYAEYIKRGRKFAQEYEKLLSITGKDTLENIAQKIGIDISCKSFWRNALKTIEDDIENFISITRN